MLRSAIVFFFLFNPFTLFSQNILDGVYVKNETMVHYHDSMSSYFRGRVVEFGTAQPLGDVLVELHSSDGQSFGRMTDPEGNFEFRDVDMKNRAFTVIYSKPPLYKVQTWNFNTTGLSEPLRIRKEIELKKAKR